MFVDVADAALIRSIDFVFFFFDLEDGITPRLVYVGFSGELSVDSSDNSPVETWSSAGPLGVSSREMILSVSLSDIL